MPAKQQDVLIALLKLEKASFRGLQKETRISPRILKRYLQSLLEKQQIRMEGEPTKKGLPHYYFLTKKGQRVALKAIFEAFNEKVKAASMVLQTIKELSDRFISSDKMEDWRKASSEALLNVKITEDMPLEERIETVLAVDKRTFGLLTESYKNMHRLICEVYLWKLKEFAPESFDPAKFFIGFPQGGLYFIHVQFLKEKGLYEEQRVFSDEGKRSQRHRAL